MPTRENRAGLLRRLAEGGSGRFAVLRFAASGLIVLAIVGLGGVELLRSTGRSEGLRDAREVTELLGEGVVGPAVTPALLRGEPAAIAAMDRLVRRRIIKPPVVRVKLWLPSGRIVYSDDHRLIGTDYALPADEQRSLRTGVADAEVSDLSKPENRFERGNGTLLEVYLGLSVAQGQRVLFETYQRYSSVASSGRRLWLAFLPVLVGALVLLALLQVPLAWSLAQRVRRAERLQRRSLERAMDAHEHERRRIAADLHDGVVQTLVGISYRLGAIRGRLTGRDSPELVQGLDESAQQTRESIRQLRSLLVDIYPPSLEREGLAAALEDLTSTADDPQIAISLRVSPGLPELPPQQQALLFRGAQEALRNAVGHSRAAHIDISLDDRRGAVALTVADDGIGFDPHRRLQEGGNGHFGLRALEDLAREEGGAVHVESRAGAGTRIVVEVPA
ncbi:MAG TPA: sensor histidine kinase [Solirubrobacteraceae bacterium]|nr:sensor histidine kinase [Solirubrobacteraceae bacterium]